MLLCLPLFFLPLISHQIHVAFLRFWLMNSKTDLWLSYGLVALLISKDSNWVIVCESVWREKSGQGISAMLI